MILQLIDKDVHHIYEINTLKVKVMGDRQCFPKFTFSGLGFSDPRSHTFTWTFPFKTPNEHTFTWHFPLNHPVNTLSRGTSLLNLPVNTLLRGTFPLKPSNKDWREMLYCKTILIVWNNCYVTLHTYPYCTTTETRNVQSILYLIYVF